MSSMARTGFARLPQRLSSTGTVRQPREGEKAQKFNPLVKVETVNGADPEASRNRVDFSKLTPLYPQERLRLARLNLQAGRKSAAEVIRGIRTAARLERG